MTTWLLQLTSPEEAINIRCVIHHCQKSTHAVSYIIVNNQHTLSDCVIHYCQQSTHAVSYIIVNDQHTLCHTLLSTTNIHCVIHYCQQSTHTVSYIIVNNQHTLCHTLLSTINIHCVIHYCQHATQSTRKAKQKLFNFLTHYSSVSVCFSSVKSSVPTISHNPGPCFRSLMYQLFLSWLIAG